MKLFIKYSEHFFRYIEIDYKLTKHSIKITKIIDHCERVLEE